MSKRRQHSELVRITPNSGVGAGARYTVIMPDGQYRLTGERAITDQTSCMLDCDDEDCLEWTDLFSLPSNTRGERSETCCPRTTPAPPTTCSNAKC